MDSLEFVGLDDTTLIQLVSESAVRAFDALYDRYWEQLFLYTVKAVRDRDVAEDIVQEVFVSLWTKRCQLKKVENVKSYLLSACRYQGIAYFRNQIKAEQLTESYPKKFDNIDLSLESMLFAKELSLIIDENISSLPPKMREVFLLSRREELSHLQISEKLHISVKTVKKQVSNALKIMRLKLGGMLLALMFINLF